jgi:hypothetical protein
LIGLDSSVEEKKASLAPATVSVGISLKETTRGWRVMVLEWRCNAPIAVSAETEGGSGRVILKV